MSEEEDMERSVDLMIEQEEIVDRIDRIRNEFRGRGLACMHGNVIKIHYSNIDAYENQHRATQGLVS